MQHLVCPSCGYALPPERQGLAFPCPACRAPFTPDRAAPRYNLYSANLVALAAFLGGPVGGSVVMAFNFVRLGRTAAAVGIVALGAVAAVGLVALAFVLPL